MLINKENITSIIPQKAPFVMIHNLLEASLENGFTSSFTITEDNIFLQDGQLSESALVENIAQTSAAGFGYLDQQSGLKEPRLGFIGAVTKLKVNAYAQLNDQLKTHVSILNSFDKVILIKGEVFRDQSSLIECQMKIVMT